MGSEIARRYLETKRYISAGALKRDQPACDGGGKGEAYTKSGSCTPPESNPYNRGCSKYYRCERWVKAEILFDVTEWFKVDHVS